MAGVGLRVRSLRFRLDRSEASFADLLGVEADVVRMWERGEGLDREALILIASATDTAMEWLIAGLTAAEVAAIHEAARARRPPTPASPADGDDMDLGSVGSAAPAASPDSDRSHAHGGRTGGGSARKTRKRR